MKKINFSIDVSDVKVSANETVSLKELWKLYILTGARAAFKDGSDGILLYKIGKIIDKITDGEADLEDAEHEVLKNINERGKFDPSWYTFVPKIKQRIEDVK